MKKLTLLVALIFGVGFTSYAQQDTEENLQRHTVEMGETVLIIAKRYKIKPRDIYDYNPGAVEGLSPNAIIQIPFHRQLQKQVAVVTRDNNELPPADENIADAAPAPQKEAAIAVTAPAPVQLTTVEAVPEIVKEVSVLAEATAATPQVPATIEHVVKAGETLYRLSRNYNTTVAAIEKENAASLKKGLRVGQKLMITTTAAQPSEVPDAGYIAHNVAPGETLTGISKKYNTTIEALTQSNKEVLAHGLRAGQLLMVLPGSNRADVKTDIGPNNIAPLVEKNKGASSIADMVTEHQVKTGETLLGLANKYNTTIDTIIQDNKLQPDGGLQAGQVLKIKEKYVKNSVTAGREE